MLRISLREIVLISCSIFFSLRDCLSRDNWASASRTSNFVPIPASNFALAFFKLVIDKSSVNFYFGYPDLTFGIYDTSFLLLELNLVS